MIHINQPDVWPGRTIRHCTTCKVRRRFIVRLYEYYPARWTCGGCGYTFCKDEGRRKSGKKPRQRRRQWVKDTWGNVQRYRDAVRRMCKDIETKT